MFYKKYSGAGNDFILINNTHLKIKNHRDVVLDLMNRKEYERYDGVIFIEPSEVADFKMNYFNRDGSGNALCGNGLRCATKFILDTNMINKSVMNIEAVGNIYKCAMVDTEYVAVTFPPPVKMKLNIELEIDFINWLEKLKCSFIDVGSPHLVVFIEDLNTPFIESLEDIPLEMWGRNLRYHKDLMPAGANVHFIELMRDANPRLHIRSYERGVERETLACGTGAISSALAAHYLKDYPFPIKLYTRAAEFLIVDATIENNKIEKIILTGSAFEIH